MEKWFPKKKDKHTSMNLQCKGTKLRCLFCSATRIAVAQILVQGDDWEDDCRSLFNDWTEDGWTVLTNAPIRQDDGP